MEIPKRLEVTVNFLAGLATISGMSLSGGIYYFIKLEDRISQLEQKVSSMSSTSLSTISTGTKENAATRTTENAMVEACANLAKRSADEISKGAWLNSDQIQKTMSGIGCTRSQ